MKYNGKKGERMKYGYIGVGKYRKSTHGRIYEVWRDMLRRCYDDKRQIKSPTYKGCTVCEEWHNFQNFAKWYEENYYEIEGQRMHLDKDILFKGNKIYSPQTCIFVPQRINLLFTKSNAIRGLYPIGIDFHKKSGKLRVRCDIYEENCKKRICLGMFLPSETEEAFAVYKKFKENYIKQVANEYKDFIPKKLYDALYVYEVEITD